MEGEREGWKMGGREGTRDGWREEERERGRQKKGERRSLVSGTQNTSVACVHNLGRLLAYQQVSGSLLALVMVAVGQFDCLVKCLTYFCVLNVNCI